MKRGMRETAVLCAAVLSSGIVLMAAACHKQSGNQGDDTVQYIVYTGGGNIDGANRVKEQVNKYVEEKLGFKVELTYNPYTSYSEKLGLKFNSNEYFDMCYTASLLTGNPYSLRASEGFFKDITNELPEYAPNLYQSLDSKIWDAAKVDGKIYGVINEQIFARCVGVAIDKEIVKDLSIDGKPLTQANIDENGWTYEKVITAAMEMIKNDPAISQNGVVPQSTLILGDTYDELFLQNYSFDNLGTATTYPGVIRATAATDNTKVINQYDTPEFKQFVQFCMNMYEKGYLRKDQTVDITENQRVRLCGTYRPGAESELYIQVGREFEQFRFGTPLLTTSNITSSMTAISANSTKVDKCLKLLDLMYTDKEFYNLIAVGEEGAEYVWTSGEMENEEGVMEEYEYIEYIPGNTYMIYADWAFPTIFNAYRKIFQPADLVERIRKINNEAAVSPANGFAFIPSRSVSNYQRDCDREISIVIQQLLKGTYSSESTADSIVADLNTKLQANGLSDILAEKQSKLDAFLAAK